MLEWIVEGIRRMLPPEEPEVIKVVERVPQKKGKGGLKLDSEFTIYFPEFRGDEWKWKIPVSTYLAYKAKSRKKNNWDEESYWKFVTPEDAHLYEITEDLARDYLGSRWRKHKLSFAQIVVDFVSRIPYHQKDETPNYIKYPLEMLCEFGGNCADASVLAASMLAVGNVETCFIFFHRHVVLGLDVPAEGKYINYGTIKKFYVADPTGSDWPRDRIPPKIGSLNAEFDLTKVKKIEFKP